ncbi:hypothetical protein DHD05_03780 [Arenibacter sp. N53]|nr:hypothetical protein [Arenibacter sp. N53]
MYFGIFKINRNMTRKQGEENTQILKDENDPSDNYIFQDNKKTKIGAAIITAVLLIILAGLILSGLIFEN